jgi:hypothetical protein
MEFPFVRRLAIAACALFVAEVAAAEEKSWRFPTFRYAPCENVGVHGSYSVDVRADVRREGSATTIRTLSVAVDSAAFKAGSRPAFNGYLLFKDSNGKETGSRVLLADAWFDVLQSANSSALTKYLPPQTTPATKQTPQKALAVPAGISLHVVIIPIVSVDNSACPLGKSENQLTL